MTGTFFADEVKRVGKNSLEGWYNIYTTHIAKSAYHIPERFQPSPTPVHINYTQPNPNTIQTISLLPWYYINIFYIKYNYIKCPKFRNFFSEKWDTLFPKNRTLSLTTTRRAHIILFFVIYIILNYYINIYYIKRPIFWNNFSEN